MTQQTMTTERVFELIETYGAEPGAWPEGERAAAAALLEAAPEQFEAALSEARALDQMLMAEPAPEPSASLSEAILAQAPRARGARKSVGEWLSSLIFPQGVRWPAGAAFASLVMGLVGGYAYASTGIGYDQADAAYYSAFDWSDGAEWLGAE